MDIKQEFREEKNMDVYATNVNDGSFSNVYVKWLEAKLTLTDVGNCPFEADNIYRLQEEIRKLSNEKQVLKTTVKFLEEKIKIDPVLDLFFDIPNDRFKDVIERLNLLKKSWAWKNEDKCQIIEGSVW